MQLSEYLEAAGFRKESAGQIARAYADHDESEFDIWLTDTAADQGQAQALRMLCEHWRKQYGGGRASRVVSTIVEPLAARSFCFYRVVGPQDAYGRCWAAMRVPLHFPGAMDNAGGQSPAEFAVVAAEQDPDTRLFKWISLTPPMKATFGFVLEQAGIELSRWAIVREYDRLRSERPGQKSEPTDPEEPGNETPIPM